MSRYDQDNLDHLDLPDPVTTTATYFTDDGQSFDRDNLGDSPAHICAKEIVFQDEDSHSITHFVLCDARSQLYDPRDTDVRYRTRNVWKFRRVTKTCFDLYIRFLQEKYTSLLRQAQRVM